MSAYISNFKNGLENSYNITRGITWDCVKMR